MRIISEILKQKGPQFNTINADATVLEAIITMKADNLSYVIVMDGENYTGIFTERDYTHKVILLNRHSDTTLVKEVMTSDLPTVTGTDKAEYCMRLMNSAKTRYLPVFDGLDFKGVITIHDLMRESIAEHEKDEAIENFGEKIVKSDKHYWI